MSVAQAQGDAIQRGASDRAGPIIHAHNVFKTYRLGKVSVPVLRGASITVDRGEWVAILGASGSGKSTLLHLMGGLDRPTKPDIEKLCPACAYDVTGISSGVCPECGRALNANAAKDTFNVLRFGEVDLASMSAGELDRYRNQSVGFVFQFYHLLPELRVVENVLVPAMARWGRLGYLSRRGELRDRAEKLLVGFGLGHRFDHRPVELSGGERQRVAIARALINNPDLLLADEPTGNLDRTTGQAILDQIASQRTADGRTLVMVTHDREVAARADRIVHLTDGRIVHER